MCKARTLLDKKSAVPMAPPSREEIATWAQHLRGDIGFPVRESTMWYGACLMAVLFSAIRFTPKCCPL